MEKFDVIIVGAGPGGLKCAEILSQTDKTVLIIEKNSEIGPKVCAGGLTAKDVKYLNLPNDLIEHKFDLLKIYVNSIKANISHQEDMLYTIDRKEFGQWQLQKIKNSKNITIRTNSRVSSINNEYIIVNGEKIGYKQLVGADGSNSTVRRHLDLKSESKIMGLQYTIETDRFKDFEIFLNSKYFGDWYAWIFPHNGYVAIGCGSNCIKTKQLRINFDKWLTKRGIDVSKAKLEAFPMACDYVDYKFDNIYLIGDAAGLVSSLTGEGIYPALVSGEEIAKQIIDTTYDPLPKLEPILRSQNRHAKILKMLGSKYTRTLLFFLGQSMLRIPYYRKKIIRTLC